MDKEKEYLMGALNPSDYIDRSLKSKIPRGIKATITHEWLIKTGYSINDIVKARYNNKYWKSARQKGSNERTLNRIHNHDYSRGSRTGWDDQLVKKFLAKNKRLADGSYAIPDFELAKFFETTIPAIQYMRRKELLSQKVVEISTAYDMLSLMRKSEQAIKRILNGLESR